MNRQVCVTKIVAYRQTHTQTGKTEGPMILSNDIFFFKTVIIGSPMIKQIDLKTKHPLTYKLLQDFVVEHPLAS